MKANSGEKVRYDLNSRIDPSFPGPGLQILLSPQSMTQMLSSSTCSNPLLCFCFASSTWAVGPVRGSRSFFDGDQPSGYLSVNHRPNPTKNEIDVRARTSGKSATGESGRFASPSTMGVDGGTAGDGGGFGLHRWRQFRAPSSHVDLAFRSPVHLASSQS